MKTLFNKIMCLFFGHKLVAKIDEIELLYSDNPQIVWTCARCGKTA